MRRERAAWRGGESEFISAAGGVETVSASRREWFRSAARTVLLGGFALMSGRLLLRSDACPRRVPCQRCGLLTACELPQARSAQRERMGRM